MACTMLLRRPTTRKQTCGASVRPVAANGDAVAVTLTGIVVPNGVMLGAAVVPKRNRVRLPLETHGKFRCLDMPIQHLQNRVALLAAKADNMAATTAITARTFFSIVGIYREARACAAIPTSILLRADQAID